MAEFPRLDLASLAQALRDSLGPAAVRVNEPLARYTALRIGGPADLLVRAESVQVLRQAVLMAGEWSVPCRVLGGGCNVLIGAAGVRGLVVLNRARAIRFPAGRSPDQPQQEKWVRAESGAAFSTVARQCVARGLAGLEWAVGIPGTVGGAVVGNAGAWGGDVARALRRATILEPGGAVAEWPAERFEYGYRTSLLKRQVASGRPQAVVLAAEFALQEAEREMLEGRVADLTARRQASQPAGASCGSVFKNPPGDHAGRLIEAAGLKGMRHGGAEVSAQHANFIINHGGATASDVMALIDLARETVLARFGVELELEIELLGEW